MTTHARHPAPAERDEFLVDGCPRCEEYVADLGLHFDPARFRAFWAKMVEVEFDDRGGYASGLDRDLGRKLYAVALALERAFGVDPHGFVRAESFVDLITGKRYVTMVPVANVGDSPIVAVTVVAEDEEVAERDVAIAQSFAALAARRLGRDHLASR